MSFSYRSKKARSVLEGEPIVLIDHGQIVEREANGAISFIKKS